MAKRAVHPGMFFAECCDRKGLSLDDVLAALPLDKAVVLQFLTGKGFIESAFDETVAKVIGLSESMWRQVNSNYPKRSTQPDRLLVRMPQISQDADRLYAELYPQAKE